MNFPDSPLFHFLYWLINTAGNGSIGVAIIATISITSYFFTLRWIVRGGQVDEKETYSYPTKSLLGH